MDTKSLAKSKRAHSLHHKKPHHPNQQVKGATSSASADKAPVKEKARVGPATLPSNWACYEEEDDPVVDGQPSDVVIPKSKGADYAYLISEAMSRHSTEFFPSLGDFVSEFGQGKESFFAVRGESLLSSIENDSFYVEDHKTPANYEYRTVNHDHVVALIAERQGVHAPIGLCSDWCYVASLCPRLDVKLLSSRGSHWKQPLYFYGIEASSFLSLNILALANQLTKIDLPKRLFMESDLFPPTVQQHSEKVQEGEAYDHHKVAPILNLESVASSSSKLIAAEAAELELDMLLDSFDDVNFKEKASSTKKTSLDFDIDGTLDDLLKQTSTPSQLIDQNNASHVSISEPLDDFDSWLDTI